MAGQYPSGTEYNVYTYPTAAAYAISNMPANVQIVFVGFELAQGGDPQRFRITELTPDWLSRMAVTNPVYMVFTNLYPSSGRPSWRSLTCLYALCGVDTNSWFSRVQGSNYVDAASGSNFFTAGTGPGYKDYYLTIDATNEGALSTVLNSLITAQPSLAAPQASSPELLNNQFGFTITGTANIPVAVEACTNLLNGYWFPLQILTLTGDPIYFSDPQWKNYPTRFYRLRSP
jgi:hypothetical protein